jgi:protein-S-isoprenylcysteine O-methyltransferase Ste14
MRTDHLLDLIPEFLWRLVGVLFFAGVVAFRFARQYSPTPIFWVETLVYALIVLGYARRTPPRERAATPLEVVLPLLGGPAPFLLLLPDWQPLVAEPVVLGLFLAGGLLSAVSYAFLGGSFSILVEARELRACGPYRLVRHPVYLGQLLSATGSVLGRFVWWNVVLGAVFAAIQIARAVLEERKLLGAVPGYAEYRARTRMFVPFIL